MGGGGGGGGDKYVCIYITMALIHLDNLPIGHSFLPKFLCNTSCITAVEKNGYNLQAMWPHSSSRQEGNANHN